MIKKKKMHHLMLTPLKTRYSSVVKDKIAEINTPKRTKPKLFLFNSISPQKDKTIKANSSIKVKMYKEIFKKSNSICNIFENVYIKQQMLLKDK